MDIRFGEGPDIVSADLEQGLCSEISIYFLGDGKRRLRAVGEA